ncbi:MAG: hypothetical protein BGO26_09625 [Actinobacteria bacterium 69-20]|jgi:NAD(P)H dehydrogenase (quinone)|nr:NAD(P)H-binding protein [Actinomycetota bacterium]OJV23184.1 MAG: hypothetical protein BGO26_09625 [Actinobacteria bacterium 69-20]
MSLIVTGASGHLGTAAAERVIALRGSSADLVLVSRRPAAIAERFDGADIRHGDFADPAGLVEAFRGGDRMLLISADNIQARAAWHAAAIDAAKAAGVQHIIYTSMIEPGAGNPALIADSHRATEQHLRASGIGWTVLRCALYSDFQVFEAAEAVASGQFRHNRGDGRCSYVARADCAAVAAAVLTSDNRSGIVDVTGPDALDATDLAALYATVGRAEVAPVSVTDEELAAALRPADGADPDGHAQYGAALAVSLGRAIREGYFGAVTGAVAEITGRRPASVADLLQREASTVRALSGR